MERVQRKTAGRKRIYNTPEEIKRARVAATRKYRLLNREQTQQYIDNEKRKKRIKNLLKKIDIKSDSDFIAALAEKISSLHDDEKQTARVIIGGLITDIKKDNE